MPTVPSLLLKKLYLENSLKTTTEGFGLSLKNTLAPGTITAISALSVDGRNVSLDSIFIGRRETRRPAPRISPKTPFRFDLGEEALIWVDGISLSPGPHVVVITLSFKEVGELRIPVEDRV